MYCTHPGNQILRAVTNCTPAYVLLEYGMHGAQLARSATKPCDNSLLSGLFQNTTHPTSRALSAVRHGSCIYYSAPAYEELNILLHLIMPQIIPLVDQYIRTDDEPPQSSELPMACSVCQVPHSESMIARQDSIHKKRSPPSPHLLPHYQSIKQ
jgi:hypothetical protein